MIQTYNILSLLLDYPTETLWDSRSEVLPALMAEGVLNEKALDRIQSFLNYVATFANARSWQPTATSSIPQRRQISISSTWSMVRAATADRPW